MRSLLVFFICSANFNFLPGYSQILYDQFLRFFFRNGWYVSEACFLSLKKTSVSKYNNVLTPDCHESCISYLWSILNPTNMQWDAAIFNVIENYLGSHLGDLQYYKRRKCVFRNSRDWIHCCMYTIDAGWEVGMAQFKCKHTARIPESLYEPWIWDSEEPSVQIFSLDEFQ